MKVTKRLITLITILAIVLSVVSFSAYATPPEVKELEQEFEIGTYILRSPQSNSVTLLDTRQIKWTLAPGWVNLPGGVNVTCDGMIVANTGGNASGTTGYIVPAGAHTFRLVYNGSYLATGTT